MDWVHLAATLALGGLAWIQPLATHKLLFLASCVIMVGIVWLRFSGSRHQPPKVKLRREGMLFCGLAILFGLAATNTGSNMLYLSTAAMLSFLVLSGVLSSLTFVALSLEREGISYAQVGVPTSLPVTIRNRKPLLASFAVRVVGDHVRGDGGPWSVGQLLALRVPGRGELRGRLPLTPRQRGVLAGPPLRLLSRFPFAFIEKWRVIPPADGETILVLPAIGELRSRRGERNVRTQSVSPSAGRRRGEEMFRGVREYRSGDNPRHIHWKSSARVGELRVREHERGLDRRARLVLLGAGIDEAELELAISYAATIVHHWLAEGLLVDLATDDPEAGSVTAAEGRDGERRALEILARYDAAGALEREHAPESPAGGDGELWIVAPGREGVAPSGAKVLAVTGESLAAVFVSGRGETDGTA